VTSAGVYCYGSLAKIMLFRRPKTLLMDSLPGKTERCMPFNFSDEPHIRRIINERVERGKWLLFKCHISGNSIEMKQQALKVLTGAQLLAACPVLLSTLVSLQQSVDDPTEPSGEGQVVEGGPVREDSFEAVGTRRGRGRK